MIILIHLFPAEQPLQAHRRMCEKIQADFLSNMKKNKNLKVVIKHLEQADRGYYKCILSKIKLMSCH